ncbi:MAG: hypothetical protein ACKOC8_12655 [Pirellulales bacterium]
MTTRERWTVYPLLFLAIGLALRGVAVPPARFTAGSIETGRVVCGEIVVTSDEGTKLVHIGRVKGGGGGRIEINDSLGKEAVAIGTGAEGRDGSLEFFDAAGLVTTRVAGGSTMGNDRNTPAVQATDGADRRE